MDMSLSKLQELVTDREAWHACSPWGRKELYTMEQLNWQLFSFPGGAVLKNLPANAEDEGSIPGLGWSPGVGNGSPFQYSCLKNSMDRGAWQAIVHGVAKSQPQMSYWAYMHTLSVVYRLQISIFLCCSVTLFQIISKSVSCDSLYNYICFSLIFHELYFILSRGLINAFVPFIGRTPAQQFCLTDAHAPVYKNSLVSSGVLWAI